MFKLKINYRMAVTTKPLFIIKKGDWIDLSTVDDINLKEKEYRCINLGIALQLPKGYEAIVAPRSSTYKNYHIICPNSIGIIDYEYRGNNDVWKFPALAIYDTYIPAYTRIAQFRIQLSQKATIWQKIKWLFTNKIELNLINEFKNTVDRGGLGSTGKF